ncbi:MAG: long-chain-acyl-CoA synthetase [bacterium]|nr:long-chain-acyl-CoA synthetase [bacterium]
MSSLHRFFRGLRFWRSFAPFFLRAAKARPNRQVDYSDWLAPHFRAYADRPVLIGESGNMTWAEFDAFANQVAHWALGEGFRRGDVVSLLMENRPEYVAIWLGLSRIGVVTALLNTNLSGERLAHCMRAAGASHLLVGVELVEAAASALSELEAVPQIFAVSGSAEQGVDLMAVQRTIPSAESLDIELESQAASEIEDSFRADRRAGDGLFLIFTSGTTGLPKAARVSHSRAMTIGVAAFKLQRLTANDRVYSCLPLYHSAGGLMAVGAALFAGGSLVISRRFSAKRFWSDCAQHDVTAIQYIGELCRYLLNSPPHPDERQHKIRIALGNGLRPEVWTPFQQRFGIPRIIEFYGATEGNLALFNLEGRTGAVGYLPNFIRRLLGVEIARFDLETEEVERGEGGFCLPARADEPGELLIKISETVRFEGYTDEGASAKKILRDVLEKGDAYFRSGDLLRLDDEGFFFFVDRIGDTFRWKGENVATSEVAEVISVVAGIEEANVYGVEIAGTDGRAGMAALVTNEGFDLEQLGSVVEEGLAPYARPVFVRILSEMEITGTFKHRKVELVKEGFDPACLSDPIYYREPEKGTYVPLEAATFDRIVAGELRL